MGMVAAVPTGVERTLADKDARWLLRGVQAGYASPVSDGERLYLLDNGGVLIAIDLKTGKQLWSEGLGTIAKASPVYADGKLYIGTENTGNAGGKVFIIRPTADQSGDPRPGLAWDTREIGIDHCGADRRAWPRLRHLDGCAVCDRTEGSSRRRPTGGAADHAAETVVPQGATAATALVTPTELILKPGESVDLAREAVRRQWQPHQRFSGGRDVDRREPQGHGRERQVHRGGRPPALRRASSRPLSAGSPACREYASFPTCRGRSTSKTSARSLRPGGSTRPANTRCVTSRRTATRYW